MTPAAYGNRSTGSVADCRESGSMGRTAAAAIGVASLPAAHGRLHPSVGDVRRFATPQQLMAFLGLVPSERTTGDTGAARLHYEDRQSSSTTGAEGSFSARVGETLRGRLKDSLKCPIRPMLLPESSRHKPQPLPAGLPCGLNPSAPGWDVDQSPPRKNLWVAGLGGCG